jgi:catechol 2,3-dioxygenase-like lactoylglutathione lyase family enzyme
MRTALTTAGILVVSVLLARMSADLGPSVVLNACHVSPIVDDLDRSARFYHDVLGMDLMPPPPAGPLPVDTDPGHLLLHGVPQARLRFIQARIPGVRCGIEIVELTNIDRKAIRRRAQDPGAVTLVLTVRNLDFAFAALKTAGAHVVTTGGVPIVLSGAPSARAVTVQDPDGHDVELQQFEPAAASTIPASSNVIGIGLRLTVANLQQSLGFYGRVLGITGTIQPFEHDRARLALAGLPVSGRLRTGSVPIPGTSRTLELVEFRGVDSKSVAAPSRIQDPGSYRLQLTFRDIEATMGVLTAEGLRTVSTGGTPVTMSFGGRPWRLAIVPDPNNLFLIVQQAPSASP